MLGPLGQVQTTVTTALFINHHVNLHGLSTMLHPYMMRNHTKKKKVDVWLNLDTITSTEQTGHKQHLPFLFS